MWSMLLSSSAFAHSSPPTASSATLTIGFSTYHPSAMVSLVKTADAGASEMQLNSLW